LFIYKYWQWQPADL